MRFFNFIRSFYLLDVDMQISSRTSGNSKAVIVEIIMNWNSIIKTDKWFHVVQNTISYHLLGYSAFWIRGHLIRIIMSRMWWIFKTKAQKLWISNLLFALTPSFIPKHFRAQRTDPIRQIPVLPESQGCQLKTTEPVISSQNLGILDLIILRQSTIHNISANEVGLTSLPCPQKTTTIPLHSNHKIYFVL